MTNNHVIEDATKLRVKLNDGRKFDAKVIGTDPTTDVALIKVEGKDLPTIPFGNSEGLRLGEWVLAIGSPFDLQSTITAGIVSAKARQLDVIPDQFRIESFIQTDAAVNPGNSGGALVNTRGELVGINTLIKSQTGSYIGYSFAIPESIVKKVVVDLKEYGVVQAGKTELITREAVDVTAALGGKFRDAGTKLCQELEIKGGVQVVGIKSNGILARARVKEGFVITHINDRPVYSLSDMERMSDKITSIDGIYPNGRAASYMLVE